ncbi:MAG TPA: hypothetical protein VKR22_02240 [Acidimicrobiales bacterium]|nr:hypothetical protein [Acidimicrobiales bacterium]
MSRRQIPLRVLAALAFFGLVAGACGDSAATSTGATHGAPTYPPVPAGGTDCGIYDALSGWPTTVAASPAIYTCLINAFTSGQPARLVVIDPSRVNSGRYTRDGYAIPAGIVTTYRVLGARALQVTTDRQEARGPVTVQNCTGLSQSALDSPPTPSGCKPG